MEGPDGGRLVQMCLEAACRSKESVKSWRRQRRTLERMPAHLAEPLLQQLLLKHLLSPPLLEAFQFSVEDLYLSGELAVDAEWMAYIGGFRHLRVLNVADCKSLTNAAIWHLSGLDSLEELHMDRCRKITDEGLGHISTIKNLKRLRLSQTGVGQQGLAKLSVLTNLTHLDLGGLPVTDGHLKSLQVLRQLIHLDLWGSKVSNEGALMLEAFPRLKEVNLAWTTVSVVPPLPSLAYLNLCSCTVLSIFEGCSMPEVSLDGLVLSRATIQDPFRSFSGSFLMRLSAVDLSATNLETFNFLSEMRRIVRLDLSSTRVRADSMNFIAQCGANLKWLDLGGTRVGSECIEALTGHVPVLEYISLRGTLVDDKVLVYLGIMPSLTSIDVSHTNLKGLCTEPVAWSVLHLQGLPNLMKLDLRYTNFSDKSCKRLASLVQLSHLRLRAEFLTDKSLHVLSTLPNLLSLSFQGSVLTDSGLLSFKPPPLLKELDLTDCWLLTEKSIFQFAEANPHISLKHELVDKVGSANKQHQRFMARKFDADSTFKRNRGIHSPKVKPVTSASMYKGDGNLKVKDERIQYTRSQLLHLASLPPVHLDLNDFPSLLRNH